MKPLQGSWPHYVLATLVCFGLALVLAQTQWLQNLEDITLDDRTQVRARYQPKPDPRLVVIGIDNDSMDRFAADYGRWPWPRHLFGRFMALAANEGVSSIVWDLLFVEPDKSARDNDAKLAMGARIARSKATDVIFAAVLTDESSTEVTADALTRPLTRLEGEVGRIPSDRAIETPLAVLQPNAYFALANTPPGPDGVRRIAPLLGRVGDRVYPSLALEAVLRFWQVLPEDVRVRLGDAIYVRTREGERRIPISETGGYLVNYRFAEAGANLLPFAKLYLQLERRHVLKDAAVEIPELREKILLVGQNSEGLTDNGRTPLSRLTPLVLVHANAIDNILRADFARRAPWWIVAVGCLAVGLGGLAFFSDRRIWHQAVFGLGVPALYVAAATVAWIKWSIAWPVVWPVLGFAILQVFTISRRLLLEQRAKEQIKGMFGTYVSPAVVHRMIESGEVPRLGGHQVEITAYFSDIQGFSTFSEKMPPDRLVELMNEYLTICTDIVQEEGGTLDKYIGDAVVAMFGAPLSLPDHAYRACVASQRVQQAMVAARAKWRGEGAKWPDIVSRMQTRIGLNSGPAIIGNMGSRSRFNYTMMGDNVNLAARMESGAKTWGTYALITEATKLSCEQHGGDRVVTRALGRIRVVGRGQAVGVFEIVGLKETLSPTTRECAAKFEAGLARYVERDWPGAIQLLTESARFEPNQPGVTPGVTTNPSLVYLERAQRWLEAPPPADWDGTFEMKEK